MAEARETKLILYKDLLCRWKALLEKYNIIIQKIINNTC